jgi:hypothetical protein
VESPHDSLADEPTSPNSLMQTVRRPMISAFYEVVNAFTALAALEIRRTEGGRASSGLTANPGSMLRDCAVIARKESSPFDVLEPFSVNPLRGRFVYCDEPGHCAKLGRQASNSDSSRGRVRQPSRRVTMNCCSKPQNWFRPLCASHPMRFYKTAAYLHRSTHLESAETPIYARPVHSNSLT